MRSSRKNRKSRLNGRGRRRGPRGPSGGMKPPQFSANYGMNHKFRFTSTSNARTAITVAGLLAVSGVVATTTVLGSPFWSSVKVRTVEMWSPPATQGSTATCSVNWEGGANSPNKEISDTTNSVSVPAHIRCAPPKASLASFWSNNSNDGTIMFTVVAPIGTIIEVFLSLVINDDEAAPVTFILVGATAGNVYFAGLDGFSGGLYPPVSLTTIG